MTDSADPATPAPDAAATAPAQSGELPPVQCCPFCGEALGSYFGRHDTDGGHWCESCLLFFRVELV